MKFELEVVVTTKSVTNFFIHGFHKNMSVTRKLIKIIFNHRRKKTIKSYATDF